MDLVAWVREDFGIPLIGVQPTGLGADARAVTFVAEARDGSRYAVKTSTAPQLGLVVADFLAAQGVCGIPAPVRALDGGLTAVRGGQRLSVVPWVGQRRALEGGMDEAQWRGLGRLLAQVHAIHADDPVLAVLPTEGPDPGRLVQRARAMPGRLTRCSAGDSLLRELRDLWGAHQARVLEVADRAEALVASPAWAVANNVVCHSDPHQGNIVVGADGDVWLLDWDDAVLAAREADLMFALGGVLAFAPITADEKRAFFDGYGTTDWDVDLMGYFQCVRALDDVLSWSEEVLANAQHRNQQAREALDIVRGILSPAGLVAHALGEAPS
ncbi:MAG TPA: phosphotransferase [Pedococcus sp.]|nr:phosphotransferase [Pedococcus sp.]